MPFVKKLCIIKSLLFVKNTRGSAAGEKRVVRNQLAGGSTVRVLLERV